MKQNQNEKTISEIYNFPLDTEPKTKNNWLVKDANWIISLSPDEVDSEDVSLLLRQGFIPDFAVPKATEFLLKNPLSGDMYDGELLDSLAECKADLKRYKICLTPIIPFLMDFSKTYAFELPDFKDDFTKSVDLLASRQ